MAASRSLRFGFAAIASLLTLDARADDTNIDLFKSSPASGWIITIGGVAEFSPKFEGAKGSTFEGLPKLSWRHVGEAAEFSSPEDGLGIALFSTERFKIGPVASYSHGRSPGDDPALAGLRVIPWSIEAGMFVEFWPVIDHLRTRAELRQGFNGRQGFVWDLSADWVEKFNRITLSGGPRMLFADKAFMNTNFGITPAEAAANGSVTAFNPASGLESVGAGMALKYDWSDIWATTAFVEYDRLVSDAAHSPIVQVLGDKNQFTVGIELAYSFSVN
jgi:outer membrane scaffolding protein for murein synthesis (MipA/OmpV family)